MAICATMGLKKIYIAPSVTDGTMPANGSDWVDLGDIYKETCQLVDEDVEETVHESETSSKKIIVFGNYSTGVNLSLMDPNLEMLAKLFGGTIMGTNGKRKWMRPLKPAFKEWAIKLLPEEGLMVSCAVVSIKPKFEITYSSKGICLVPLTVKFNKELQIDEEATDPTTTA